MPCWWGQWGAPEGSAQQVALSKPVWGHGVQDWVAARSRGLSAWVGFSPGRARLEMNGRGRRDGLPALSSEGPLPSVLSVVEGVVSGRPPSVSAIAAAEVAEQGPPTGGSAGCGGQEPAVHSVLSTRDSRGAMSLPMLVGAREGKGGLGSWRSRHQGELRPWGGGRAPAQPGAGPRCFLVQCCWRRAGAEARQAC